MTVPTIKPFPTLATGRITLRQLRDTDAEHIFILRSDSEIKKYLNRPIAKSIDEARHFIATVVENYTANGTVYWAITLDDDVLVGTICLFGFSGDQCEIGYELLPDYQQQGIMAEAAQCVIDYAFRTLKVEKIEAHFHRDNERSAKLLAKFDFVNAAPEDASPEVISYLYNPQTA